MSNGTPNPPGISHKEATAILAMLRDARSMLYRDAESFDEAATVLEHVGQILAHEVRNGLGYYETEIVTLAALVPRTDRRHLRALFDTVRRTRNDSVHSGDFIRHHVMRLVELFLILEEAISAHSHVIGDLMVRNPVTAELWHNLAAVRRAMLVNSFSYLPVKTDVDGWKLVSDVAVVRFLNGFQGRNQRLGRQLGDAIKAGEVELLDCRCFGENEPITDVLTQVEHRPVLVTDGVGNAIRLLGILTAFDLL